MLDIMTSNSYTWRRCHFDTSYACICTCTYIWSSKKANIYRADRGRNPHLHVFSGSEPPTLSAVENLPQSLRSSPRWRRSWRPFQSGKLWEACAMDLNKSIYVPPTCKLRLLSISLLHKALCVPKCVMQSIFCFKGKSKNTIKAQSIGRSIIEFFLGLQSWVHEPWRHQCGRIKHARGASLSDMAFPSKTTKLNLGTWAGCEKY